jgi:hypothetical protein
MMDVSAAWSRTRAEFRTSWRAVIAISLVVAFGAGVALTAAAGARRTQTAMRRFVAYNRPEDATLFFSTTPEVGRRVVALLQVARWTQFPYLYMSTDPSKFDPRTGVFGAEDAAALHTIERPLVVRGRLSHSDRVNEVMVNEREASAFHLHVGSSFTLYAFSLRQTLSGGNADFTGPTRPEGPRYRVRVVGVVREPTDIAVVPDARNVIYESSGTVYATPALVADLAHAFGESVNQLPGSEIVRIQFRRGAKDLPAFTKAAVAIAGNRIQILPGSDIAQAAGAVQHGVGVEAIALWLFAAVAALTTLLVFALNITRILRAELPDHRRLWQLGMSRRELAAVALARPFVIAITGGLLAVAFAIVASPLTPIGLARQAEVHRGVAANVTLLFAGFGTIVLLLLATALASAARVRLRRGDVARRRARSGETIAHAGLSPSMRLGLSSAWSGGDSGASPRRASIAAIAIAVTGVVAAVTFGASLDRLAASPRQQGWNFDVVVGNPNAQADQEAAGARLLGRNPHVGGFAALASPAETPTINGVSIGLAGFDVLKGAMGPVMLDGHAPRSPGDVVVASATMRRLHARIGDVVHVVAGAKTAPMRISGVMLSTSAGSLFSGRLDEGAAVTLQGLRRVEPDAIVTLFLVDYARAADPDVAFARLQRDFGPNVLRRLPARDIENLVRVDNLPWLLAALLAVLSAVTLFQTLTASVRRRNHELAILKALGFERGQLAASVMWQMWTLALGGIALGVPFGIIIARTAWRAVAENIGSVQHVVMPAGMITLLVALSALVVTALALVPAWLTTRVNAAASLRSE